MKNLILLITIVLSFNALAGSSHIELFKQNCEAQGLPFMIDERSMWCETPESIKANHCFEVSDNYNNSKEIYNECMDN